VKSEEPSQRFNIIGEVRDGPTAIQLDSRTPPRKRLDLPHISPDIALLLCRAPIWVVGSHRDAFNQHIDGCAEENDVLEAIVEPPLILGRTRHHDIHMLL
jgi:hypothetical protein